MMIQTWSEILKTSLVDIWLGFAKVIPNLIAALFIFVAGWFVANLVGQVVSQLIRALKLDSALRLVQIEHVLKQAG